MILGVFLLGCRQLWRNVAEFHSPNTCGYRGAATQGMVDAVTGISSKLSVANYQNRYPSPSKGPDLTLVRPQLCFGRKPLFADRIALTKMCMDQFAETRHYAHAKQFQLREGSKICLKNPGSSGSLPWLALRLVLIPIWNAALRALRLVRLLRMRLAAAPLLVLLSAVLRAWFATTLTSVTNPERNRVSVHELITKSATGDILRWLFVVLQHSCLTAKIQT